MPFSGSLKELSAKAALSLVRAQARNYRRGNLGSWVGYRKNSGPQDASDPGRKVAEILMPSTLTDEIDVQMCIRDRP